VAWSILGVSQGLSSETTTERGGLSRTERRRRRGTRFKVLVGVGSVVAVVLLALVVDAGLSYGKVHTGISVSGLGLSGLTESEAVAALTAHVAEAQASPIKLTSATKTWEVMPTDVGATMDIAGAVSAAMDVTREGNFFVDLGRRVKLYFDHRDLPLQGVIDSAKMDSLLAEIAQELDVPPVNAGLVIEGSYIRAIEGQSGTVVDRDGLRRQLESVLFSLHATELPIPMIAKEPDVKVEDNQAALDQARTMVSSSVMLKNKTNSWTLTPEQIAQYMEFTSEEQNGVSTLVPLLSASKMSLFFAGISGLVATEPVDASFDSDGSKAWVVDGIPGEKLDPEGTAQALTAAALRTTDRNAEVAVMESEPDFTTAEAEAMGIKDKLGSYETEPYYGSSNRQVNVRITTQYAENKLLAPGEEYDFDKTVGPRTPERGYKMAPGIVGDGVMKDVYGGGICQVSTTLFNAVFEAGLEILERHNHTLYIGHYPDGRDATVAGQGRNFRFRNDTDHYIWIRGKSDGVHTRFTIYGTDDGRQVEIKFSGFSYGAARTVETIINPSLAPGKTHEVRSGQSGRSCSVTRTVTMPDGTVLHDGPEVFKSYYPMLSKLTEVSPSTTTTTLPATTPTTGPPTSTTVTIGF
jgi:vancomycin resistance protein YoaR